MYLHNLRPLDDVDSAAAPSNLLYWYTVRIRELDPCTCTTEEELPAWGPYHDGDKVWVKLSNARCDQRYETGTVTRMLSDHAVEVNGIPRHVRDLRPRASNGDVDGTTEERDDEDDELLIRLPVGVDGVGERDSDATTDEEEGNADTVVADAEMPRRSDRIRKLRECTLCK